MTSSNFVSSDKTFKAFEFHKAFQFLHLSLNSYTIHIIEYTCICRCTYIAEYHFLQQDPTLADTSRKLSPEEHIRIPSRKIDSDGNVVFNHRTVIPICLTGGLIRKWWNECLNIKIYKKNLGHKKAVYLGRVCNLMLFSQKSIVTNRYYYIIHVRHIAPHICISAVFDFAGGIFRIFESKLIF